MYLNQYEYLLKTNIYYLSEQLNEIQEIREDIKNQTIGRIEYDEGTGDIYKTCTTLDKCIQDLEGLSNRERKLTKLIDRSKELNRVVLQSYSDDEQKHIVNCMIEHARNRLFVKDELYQDYTSKVYEYLDKERNERNQSNEIDLNNVATRKIDYTQKGLYPATYRTITKRDYPISSFALGNKERTYAYIL